MISWYQILPDNYKLKKNILIRDLDNHDLNWIKKSTPKGVSQNEYIKSILKKAQEEEQDQEQSHTPDQ